MLPFASTLTTMALYHSSLRWFAFSSCKAKTVGLLPSLIQHGFEVLRLQNLLGTHPIDFLVLTAGALTLSVYSLWQMLVFFWYSMRTSAWTFIAFFSWKPPKANMERELLHLSRIIAAVTLIVVSRYLVNFHDQAEETLQQIRSEIVVKVDYYPRSPCRNVSAQERVAFLKGGKISVATREAGRWHFRLVSCQVA